MSFNGSLLNIIQQVGFYVAGGLLLVVWGYDVYTMDLTTLPDWMVIVTTIVIWFLWSSLVSLSITDNVNASCFIAGTLGSFAVMFLFLIIRIFKAVSM